MAITQEQVKAIRQELNSLKPEAAALSGNGELTVKQTIMALAPTLERMKKRGFELPEIVSRLHEKGIEVKPQTLAKYLAEARRQKEARKAKRQAATPHCSAPQTACRDAGPQAVDTPPIQPVCSPAAYQGTYQKALDLDDEDWIGKPDYSHYGKFEIKPDTPIGEL
ncbi:MAG: hypothetical protein K2H64_04505 [Desulfovibrio sp.]|nr:hypothetical protein [Desulfovibrio sp.]